jgi:hypothetical protein
MAKKHTFWFVPCQCTPGHVEVCRITKKIKILYHKIE